jgi:hypothetical protein
MRQKILDSAVDEVSEALSMHVVPPAIHIVVVPVGVTDLLGLCNPPCSWTGMVRHPPTWHHYSPFCGFLVVL